MTIHAGTKDYTKKTQYINVADVLFMYVIVHNGFHAGQEIAARSNSALRTPWYPWEQEYSTESRVFQGQSWFQLYSPSNLYKRIEIGCSENPHILKI